VFRGEAKAFYARRQIAAHSAVHDGLLLLQSDDDETALDLDAGYVEPSAYGLSGQLLAHMTE
jgi:hypothetical protein